MSQKNKEFTYVFMISCEGAEELPLESLSQEERVKARDRMTGNLERVLSDYYSRNPEEYGRLKSI